MRNHTCIETDTRILDAVDQPVNPVLRAIDGSRRNKKPIMVKLLTRLQPVYGVGDEVRISLGDNGLASRASEPGTDDF